MPTSRAEDPFVATIRLVLNVARHAHCRVALIGGFALPFHGVQRATGDVDFLIDARAATATHDALLAAGARCLHRSDDAANYGPGRSGLAAVDFLFARRARTHAMLDRARSHRLRGAKLRVPVVDAAGLIGLKLQALANDPRRLQDEADIQALFDAAPAALDVGLLRDYFRLFEREPDLERLLRGVTKR